MTFSLPCTVIEKADLQTGHVHVCSIVQSFHAPQGVQQEYADQASMVSSSKLAAHRLFAAIQPSFIDLHQPLAARLVRRVIRAGVRASRA
jgi:hypothetical protein